MNKIIEEYKQEDTWSDLIYHEFGPEAGVSFAIGMDILLHALAWQLRDKDQFLYTEIDEDLQAVLPWKYAERYTAFFFRRMEDAAKAYLKRVQTTKDYFAHTVMEELILRACMLLAEALMEALADEMPKLTSADEDEDDAQDGPLYVDEDGERFERNSEYYNWAYAIFEDMDIDEYLPYDDAKPRDDIKESPYAFSSWDQQQFWRSHEAPWPLLR